MCMTMSIIWKLFRQLNIIYAAFVARMANGNTEYEHEWETCDEDMDDQSSVST